MSVHVLSHRECDPAAARLDSFVISIASQELNAPDHVPNWDYETPLSVRTDVTVDLNRCLESAGLDGDAILGLSMIWHATGSGLRGASEPAACRDGVNSVEMTFAGPELGGSLVFHVVLTLKRAGSRTPELTATRPGSLLWSAERRVRLEGAGSRFPISHVSFSKSGLAGGLPAAWLLLFESTDLYDSGLGNVRLYLNTDHDAVEDFIADPESSPSLQAVLRSDVNRQMVLQALNSEDLDIDATYPGDSLGELLTIAVRRNFPDRSLDEVRAIARNSPGEFEAHLQARGGFLQ